jgi:hypothetical protein
MCQIRQARNEYLQFLSNLVEYASKNELVVRCTRINFRCVLMVITEKRPLLTGKWQLTARREPLTPRGFGERLRCQMFDRDHEGHKHAICMEMDDMSRPLRRCDAPQQGDDGLARGTQCVRQVNQSSPWTSRAPCWRLRVWFSFQSNQARILEPGAEQPGSAHAITG